MEFTELAHDRLLHELDLPRHQHVHDTLRKAHEQQQQQQVTPSTSSGSLALDEQTPLLSPAPSSTAIKIADALLEIEERRAQHEDERLSAWAIVDVEWRLLARLSAPMVRLACLNCSSTCPVW